MSPLVVAETFEQARAAAAAVKVTYDKDKPNVSTAPRRHRSAKAKPWTPPQASAETPTRRFPRQPSRSTPSYVTPAETHNPMEMHATVAVWDGQQLHPLRVLAGRDESSNVMAHVLACPRKTSQVISRFIGSGFGGKLLPWPHSALAAAAARKLNRPVKLVAQPQDDVLERRPPSRARNSICSSAPTPDGKLVSLAAGLPQPHLSTLDDIQRELRRSHALPLLHAESHGHLRARTPQRRHAYAHARPRRRSRPLRRSNPRWTSSPSSSRWIPSQLRLSNDTLIDEEKGKPFSSRHLKECFTSARRSSAGHSRNPEVGSMRKRTTLVPRLGCGRAPHGEPSRGMRSTVSSFSDGTARATSATQDIGTGTYTVIAQVVSDKTGIPVDKIKVVLGDSALPPGPTSGGSTATATILPSVADAANRLPSTLSSPSPRPQRLALLRQKARRARRCPTAAFT